MKRERTENKIKARRYKRERRRDKRERGIKSFCYLRCSIAISEVRVQI